MGIKRVTLLGLNHLLRPFGLHISSVRAEPTVWDRRFLKWMFSTPERIAFAHLRKPRERMVNRRGNDGRRAGR
jgi:hypothetical protein